MFKFASAALVAACAAAADTVIITPTGSSGPDVAVIWIHGAECPNQGYTSIAQELEKQMAANKIPLKGWIGIPQFALKSPDPVSINIYVKSTLKELQAAGFKGDNIMLAGHSLGGVMAQKYAAGNPKQIKGLITMGSVLTRDNHKMNKDGTTHFTMAVPSLTIGGTKDGLLRISRVAESWYHQRENIEKAQDWMFPVVALEGVSHMQFSSGAPPKKVRNNDLNPEVTEAAAHQATASAMTDFIEMVVHRTTTTPKQIPSGASEQILAPIVEAMKQEGYTQLKPPCQDSKLVNRVNDPTCSHGSPWTRDQSQKIMAGTFPKGIVLENDDNFHMVQTVTPVHLPEIDTTCTKAPCTVKSITVSENLYSIKDTMDTGFYAIAASEMKVKMSSRQNMQVHAGNASADFHATDEVGNRCADINDAAIAWAYSKLSKTAKARYDKYGVKMVTGDDKGPYNAGPLWIWTYMEYTQAKDNSTMTVQSPMMRTPTNYAIGAAAGFHYCKVLSPFKALEYMMCDSLLAKDGIHLNSKKAAGLFLQ